LNKICVYTICKNESKFVEKWYESMREADYVYVLDTGSEDDTYNKFLDLFAGNSNCSIHRRKIVPWRFDTARNASMEYIPEDANILVCTDLDEVFEPGWADILRSKWDESKHYRAIYKYTWSHDEQGNEERTFMYDKIHSRDYYWRFPVHETLTLKNESIAERKTELMLFDDIHLHHYPDRTKSRGSYLPLLELRKQENPDDYYGRIYLAHEYCYRGLYEKSTEELKDILATCSDRLNSVEKASCYLFMGDNYFSLGKYDTAYDTYKFGVKADSTYRECYIGQAKVLQQNKKWGESISILEDCLKKTWRHYTWLERDTSWTYEVWDMLCMAYFYKTIPNKKKSALCAAKALSYSPQDERLIDNLSKCLDAVTDEEILGG
jgi:tetratricopeptide (TPR) repeat protein